MNFSVYILSSSWGKRLCLIYYVLFFSCSIISMPYTQNILQPLFLKEYVN